MTALRGEIPIIGGPLDGQTFNRRRTPLYLAVDGGPLPVHLGDRMMGNRALRTGAHVPDAGYILRRSGSKITYEYVTHDRSHL